MKIEDELRNLIISRHRSVRQFSIEIEMPYSTIDTILKKGLNKAGIQNVIKICKALGIDTDAIVEGKIEERKTNDDTVTEREKNLLKMYRSIGIDGKGLVDNILTYIYRVENEKKSSK